MWCNRCQQVGDVTVTSSVCPSACPRPRFSRVSLVGSCHSLTMFFCRYLQLSRQPSDRFSRRDMRPCQQAHLSDLRKPGKTSLCVYSLYSKAALLCRGFDRRMRKLWINDIIAGMLVLFIASPSESPGCGIEGAGGCASHPLSACLSACLPACLPACLAVPVCVCVLCVCVCASISLCLSLFGSSLSLSGSLSFSSTSSMYVVPRVPVSILIKYINSQNSSCAFNSDLTVSRNSPPYLPFEVV